MSEETLSPERIEMTEMERQDVREIIKKLKKMVDPETNQVDGQLAFDHCMNVLTEQVGKYG